MGIVSSCLWGGLSKNILNKATIQKWYPENTCYTCVEKLQARGNQVQDLNEWIIPQAKWFSANCDPSQVILSILAYFWLFLNFTHKFQELLWPNNIVLCLSRSGIRKVKVAAFYRVRFYTKCGPPQGPCFASNKVISACNVLFSCFFHSSVGIMGYSKRDEASKSCSMGWNNFKCRNALVDPSHKLQLQIILETPPVP